MSTVVLSTLADRPHLTGRLYELPNVWPKFLAHDPVTNAFLHRVAADFPQHCVVATDGDRIVAHGRSIPFALDAPGRGVLPAGGIDRVTVWAYTDHRSGTRPDTVSALAVEVDPEYSGADCPAGCSGSCGRPPPTRASARSWRRSGRTSSTSARTSP